jgi:glycerol-3-phosphate dehydrogenase (NAD(P)+)
MARVGVAVIGGGAWGVALAAAAARTGGPTWLVSRRSHVNSLPEGVTLAHDAHEVTGSARLVVLAAPSHVAREVTRGLGDALDGSHFIVHGVRGLVAGDHAVLETISEVVRQETPVRRIGALGGPVLASELVAGKPSVMVCGSHYPEVVAATSSAFVTPNLRMHTTDDLRGLEWASALVGCLAIGVGWARGIGFGPGLLAALITRSVEEAARIAAAAGGSERTLLGLAGYGDLLASIAQTERPEVLLGEALARGGSVEDTLTQAGQRVEAVELAPRVVAWARAHRVATPIFEHLVVGALTGKARDAIIGALMTAGAREPPS